LEGVIRIMNTTTSATTEQNALKDTLGTVMNTKLPAQRDAVYHGPGNPVDAVIADLTSGGWVCEAATTAANALRIEAGGVLGAFDDAIADVRTAWSREPEEVPAGDDRGLAFARTWRLDQRLGTHG
jgi:hypothetical protein